MPTSILLPAPPSTSPSPPPHLSISPSRAQKFDLGQVAPSLQALLSSGQLDVKGKRCLVPGCGRGYDVAAFAASGASASVGLEISASATKDANCYLGEALGGRPEVAACATVTEGNFFEWTPEVSRIVSPLTRRARPARCSQP